MNYNDAIAKEIDDVHEIADQFVADFERQFHNGTPFGLNALTDEQHAAWFESMVAKYPTEAFRTKDGQIVVGSPWVLMLPFTENGEEELARYMRTRGL